MSATVSRKRSIFDDSDGEEEEQEPIKKVKRVDNEEEKEKNEEKTKKVKENEQKRKKVKENDGEKTVKKGKKEDEEEKEKMKSKTKKEQKIKKVKENERNAKKVKKEDEEEKIKKVKSKDKEEKTKKVKENERNAKKMKKEDEEEKIKKVKGKDKEEKTKKVKNKGKKEDDDEDKKVIKEDDKLELDTREAPSTPEKPEGENKTPEKITLSPAQRAMMEQKRQTALLIKQEKMNRKNPYNMKTEKKDDNSKVIRINDTKLIDTGGGFFIEENDGLAQDDIDAAIEMFKEPAPLFEDERPVCVECKNKFNNSYLFHNFDYNACDGCRDNDDKHALITKTDVCTEYLLKDVDLDKRQPPLKYIVKKNPHNSRWGDMKLYLKLQVEKRALEVWGSEEALEEAIVKKEEQREVNKKKQFNKKMKELRMNVRSSLYTRATKSHKHEYGEEEYLADEDEYSRTCVTCGHSYTYDKL